MGKSRSDRRDKHGLGLKTRRPAKILSINCGSSTLKFNLFNTSHPTKDMRGVVDRIGSDETVLKYETADGQWGVALPKGDYTSASGR